MSSFKTLQNEDFVISSDSISGLLWSNGSPVLTDFFTSSIQEISSAGNYYLAVYQTASTQDDAAIQFEVAYGNKEGSGSLLYNSLVDGASYTKTIYGQYKNLILGEGVDTFTFGNVTQSEFYVINFERARYKEKLFLGSFNLKLTGSSTLGEIELTDNSKVTTVVSYGESGRIYQIVSGSSGTPYSGTGYHPYSGSYGILLPDIGVALLNAAALDTNDGYGINLGTLRNSNTNNNNNGILFRAISGSSYFGMNSEETISSDFIFVRAQNYEFNYSENPSYISGSTGEVLFSSFIDRPKTYITTIGFYNDTNDLVAVAKLSRPLEKDFTKECLVRAKLDW